MPWPSVGVFAILLAIAGATVAVLEFSGWKRVLMVGLFVLLGIGEYISIRKADSAHAAEIAEQEKVNEDQKKAIEGLQALMQANAVDNASKLGYLTAKLDDSEKLNEQYAPAIKQLAETSAQYMRKQYETKIETDKQLYDFTMGVVKKLRTASEQYEAMEDKVIQERMAAFKPGMAQAEIQQVAQQENVKLSQLFQARDSAFRNEILPDAIYAKQELQKRKLSPPTLPRTEQNEVDTALMGMLAGVHPELALADYLELMARPLSRK
jgi:hypothetical protein